MKPKTKMFGVAVPLSHSPLRGNGYRRWDITTLVPGQPWDKMGQELDKPKREAP
jgi:hypothetical protein